MGCNCGKRRNATPRRATTTSGGPSLTRNASAAVAAGSQVYHEVWTDGSFSGRKFTSLLAAQSYANKVGGEVRPSA